MIMILFEALFAGTQMYLLFRSVDMVLHIHFSTEIATIFKRDEKQAQNVGKRTHFH